MKRLSIALLILIALVWIGLQWRAFNDDVKACKAAGGVWSQEEGHDVCVLRGGPR